jgi:hypothetical protein
MDLRGSGQLPLGSAALDDAVVFGVGADPDPDHIGAVLDRDGSIVQADSGRPLGADLLEVEGPMVLVIAKRFMTTIGQTPDLFRQPVVAGPEAW